MTLTYIILAVFCALLCWVWYRINQLHAQRIRSLSDLAKVTPSDFQYLTVHIMKKHNRQKSRVNPKFSGDGGWDVIGYLGDTKRLGQCKRYAFDATI